MDIANEARTYALSEIEKFGLPNQIHFDISEKKAIELAQKLGAHETVVRVGIVLIDIKLGQAFAESRVADHVAMSVEATQEFLKDYDLEDSEKENIVHCVAAHHGTMPYKTLEAEICANADCYRFIHPKGFFTFLTVLGKRYDDFDKVLAAAEKKLDEKHGIVSLDVCKEELGEYYATLKQYIADAQNL